MTPSPAKPIKVHFNQSKKNEIPPIRCLIRIVGVDLQLCHCAGQLAVHVGDPGICRDHIALGDSIATLRSDRVMVGVHNDYYLVAKYPRILRR